MRSTARFLVVLATFGLGTVPAWQAGTVLISFTVAHSGELLSRAVKKSSGSKLLDDAAMAALDRAAPFPPMPENVAQGPLEVQVPFKFITR